MKTEVGSHPGAVCVDRDDRGLASALSTRPSPPRSFWGVEVDGHPVSAWAIQSLRGTITPEVVAGRAPRGPGEIALGSVTLKAVGKRIGDSVKVQGETGSGRYRIVGRIVLPSLSPESLQPLADGASFTFSGFQPLVPAGENETHFLLVKLRSGADRGALERRARSIPRSKNLGTPTTPIEIESPPADQLVPGHLWGPCYTARLIAAVGAHASSPRCVGDVVSSRCSRPSGSAGAR